MADTSDRRSLLRQEACPPHTPQYHPESNDFGVCSKCGAETVYCDGCGHPDDDCICEYEEAMNL